MSLRNPHKRTKKYFSACTISCQMILPVPFILNLKNLSNQSLQRFSSVDSSNNSLSLLLNCASSMTIRVFTVGLPVCQRLPPLVKLQTLLWKSRDLQRMTLCTSYLGILLAKGKLAQLKSQIGKPHNYKRVCSSNRALRVTGAHLRRHRQIKIQ